MKIYKRLVIDIETGRTLEEDFYEYEGQISECKGEKPTQTKTAPQDWQSPWIQETGNRAMTASRTPMSYYGGNAIAGFTPEQQAAQHRTSQRATAGSDLTRSGSDQMLKTIRGDYLNPETNSSLKGIYNMMAESTLPAIDTSAQSAGRYGSGAWGTMKGKAMADMGSQIYNTERANQMSAVGAAPQYAMNDYSDIAALASVGEEKRGMEQAQIDEAKQKHQFEQMEPWQRLGLASNLTTGDWGGTTDTQYNAGKEGFNNLDKWMGGAFSGGGGDVGDIFNGWGGNNMDIFKGWGTGNIF